MMRKGVKIRMVKPPKTAGLNKEEPLIPAFRRHRYVYLYEFQDFLVYRANFRTDSKLTEKLCVKKPLCFLLELDLSLLLQ